jgi:hypothetical protein
LNPEGIAFGIFSFGTVRNSFSGIKWDQIQNLGDFAICYRSNCTNP